MGAGLGGPGPGPLAWGGLRPPALPARNSIMGGAAYAGGGRGAGKGGAQAKASAFTHHKLRLEEV